MERIGLVLIFLMINKKFMKFLASLLSLIMNEMDPLVGID